MLKFATIAIVSALSAVGAAKAVVSLDDVRQPELRGPAPVAVAEEGAAQIAKAPDGHFWAEAKVDGRAVRFLIDTGATAVALSQNDAKRLGIDTRGLDYKYSVTTAAGHTRAASVKLASVSVAGARVRDVDALVIESGLETSLLGMSYLGRLSSFQATPRALILRS